MSGEPAMRIDFQARDEDGEELDLGQTATIGLWGPLYFALWMAGFSFAVMVTVPHNSGWELAGVLLGWAGWLGLMASLACHQRLPLQDLLSGLLPRERVLLSMVIAAVMFWPAMFREKRVLIDGFLWVAGPLLFLSVTPIMTRVYLGCVLAGAWMSAAMSGHEPWHLAIILIFGLSWLFAIGAVHFAYVGDPHGLAGWWPIYRLFVSVAQAALPAIAAAGAIWLIWPATGLHEPYTAVHWSDFVAPHAPARPQGEVPTLQLATLIWQMLVAGLSLVWLIWIMMYLRKLLGKRSSGQPLVDLMPEQSARMEYRAATPPKPRPKLGGTRGQIVALWRRWCEAMGREATERRDGETAREFTERINAELPAANPGAEMTKLLEQAHYAAEEPSGQDLEQMRLIVEAELSRQSLRKQIPQEPIG